MQCYCIKTLNVEISRIDDDLFQISDRSIIATTDIEEARSQEYKLKIKSNSIEFIVSVPVGGSRVFSQKETGRCFEDGCYCLEVESCDRLLSIKRCYTPDLDCAIDELIMKEDDDSKYRKMLEKREVMEIMQKHGRTKEAQKKYQELCDDLRKCGAHV